MRTNNHIYGESALWVKGVESEMAKERSLTVILRLGDRSDRLQTPKQWLPLFERVPLYTLILGTGNQDLGIDPDFEPDNGTTVQVVRRTVTRLGDITDADLLFRKGSAVPLCAVDILDYLAQELAPGKIFDPSMVMTLYWIEYLPDETPASD